MKQNTIIFIVLTAIISLGQINTDIYLPCLSIIVSKLHCSINTAQISVTVYVVGFAIAQLFYGILSDGIGRRNLVILGLLLCLIGGLICVLAPSGQWLIAGRIIQGLGAGATLSIPSAIFRDLFQGEMLAKYASYSAVIGAILLGVAPLVGGYLNDFFGWRANFIFLCLYTLLCLVAFLVKVPETNLHRQRKNLSFLLLKNNILFLCANRVFIGYSCCSLLAYGAVLAWLTGGPIVLQSVVGLSPVGFAWVYALTGVSFGCGAFINGRQVKRWGIQTMLLIGMFCMLIAGMSMLIFKLLGFINTFVIVIPAILLLFGSSLVFPNASAGILQPFPQIAGLVSALFYSSRMLGGAVFSGVIALTSDKTQLPISLALVMSAVLSLIIFYLTLYSGPTSKSS